MKRISILFCIATLTSLTTPGSASKVPKPLTPAFSATPPGPVGTSHVSFRRNLQPELR